MTSWIACLVVFTACMTLCSGENTANYTCNKNGTHMSMTLTEVKGSHSKYITLDPSDSTFGCESTETIDISGTTYLKIEILTDVSTNNPVDNTCKVSASGTIVTYTIVRQTLANTLSPTDLKYITTCDSTNAVGLTQQVSDQDIEFVGSVLPNTTLSVSDQTVSLTLLDASNGAPATVQFASDYKFQVGLMREGVEGVPVFLQITGLMASGTSTFDDPISMLTGDGCGIAGSGVFIINVPLALDASPTYTSTTVQGKTGFTDFPGGTFVYDAKCCLLSVESCCQDDSNECKQQRTYCSSLRKKRSVDESSRNGTLELSVDVIFGNGATSGLGGNKGAEETLPEKECKMMTDFWVVCIVLGVLLLVVLLFAVILFFRLRRVQRTKLVDDDRTGVRNPSF